MLKTSIEDVVYATRKHGPAVKKQAPYVAFWGGAIALAVYSPIPWAIAGVWTLVHLGVKGER